MLRISSLLSLLLLFFACSSQDPTAPLIGEWSMVKMTSTDIEDLLKEANDSIKADFEASVKSMYLVFKSSDSCLVALGKEKGEAAYKFYPQDSLIVFIQDKNQDTFELLSVDKTTLILRQDNTTATFKNNGK